MSSSSSSYAIDQEKIKYLTRHVRDLIIQQSPSSSSSSSRTASYMKRLHETTSFTNANLKSDYQNMMIQRPRTTATTTTKTTSMKATTTIPTTISARRKDHMFGGRSTSSLNLNGNVNANLNMDLQEDSIANSEKKAVSSSSSSSSAIANLTNIIPKAPNHAQISGGVHGKIRAIQNYIECLGYNYLGDPFWVVKKNYSMNRLCKMACEMISQALPIKCLEAVVLGMYLTLGMQDISRIMLSFKSICDNKVYRHIVLVIRISSKSATIIPDEKSSTNTSGNSQSSKILVGGGDKWGAIGLSRRPDLMGKDLHYNSLSELIHEYKTCYANNYHKLQRVKIGHCLGHNKLSNEIPPWREGGSISLEEEEVNRPWMFIAKEIEAASRSIRK